MVGVYTCVIRVQVSTKSGVYIRAGKSELFFPSQAGAFRRCWEHMCSCHLKLSRNHCQFSLHRPQIQKKCLLDFFFIILGFSLEMKRIFIYLCTQREGFPPDFHAGRCSGYREGTCLYCGCFTELML